MLQHWGIAYAWSEQRPGLSRGVRRDGDRGQELVRLRVQLLQDGGDVEAVDQQCRPTCPACMLEEVEELKAAGICLRGYQAGMRVEVQNRLTKYVVSVCAPSANVVYAVSPFAKSDVKSQNAPSTSTS